MAWFFKSKSELPPVTHLQQKRTQQIDSLKTFNHNVAEIKRDEEYRVSFTISGHTVALNISLPPQFPEDKPIVKVSPPLRHKWVNKSMYVTGCISLNNFVVNSVLGRVIREIVTEFEQYPPVVFAESNQQPSHLPGGLPYPQNMQNFPQNLYGQPSTGAGNVGMFPMPSDGPSPMYTVSVPNHTTSSTIGNGIALGAQNYIVPSDYPELHNLSIEELKVLIEDEEKLLEMVINSEQLKKLKAERSKLNDTCEELAKTNMSYKPEIEIRKKKLKDSYDKMMATRNSFERKCLRQQSINEQYSAESILYNLKVSAADADTESEDVAQSFLDNNLETDEFLKSFMDSRIKAHMRRVKEEKLHHMITQRGGGTF
ncbi:vacuolar protein sorting-associated protein 37A-like [Anneissia japonica]|uniref:vacuolar protein sorting-associated protein 37A-like n=1 Tax=Anneissia japonica TaxID=1529436 RepID=UPI0014259933|nr:vacuolar protein sorting-associated protein 37A-like [Anneissia japonica]